MHINFSSTKFNYKKQFFKKQIAFHLQKWGKLGY